MLYNRHTSADSEKIIIDGIPEKKNGAVRIMSFNLRYCDDKAGSVKDRSKISAAIIEQYEPDSFGAQEATGRWMKILGKALGEKYAYVAHPRDKQGYKSERNPVFYLKDKYNLIDKGTIWLSETPEAKYTKSFDSNCHRIATWAVLENKVTGERYTHINTHLDHILEETRVAQVEVLIKKLTELQKENRVFCTGDFNTDPSSKVYSRMTETSDDVKTVAKITDDGMTFHDYGRCSKQAGSTIDYIFASKGSDVATYKIIRNTFNDMYSSDHFPIVADIIVDSAE